MKKIVSLIVLSLTTHLVLAQVGDWPAYTPGYTYFGTTAIDQTQFGNYAALQDKSNGRTFLNSPLDIRFRIGNGERMILTNDGSIGIGTTSPDQKLTVAGNVTLEAGNNPSLFTGTGGSELNRYLFLLNSTGLQTASGLKAGGILVADAYNYANPSKNDLIVKGNIGIGTTSPVARLHSKITGSTNTTYSAYTNADVAVVLQNGNSTNNNFNILTYSDASGYGVADVGATTNHSNHTAKLFFSTRPTTSGPVQRMLIDENGNVGIGTASPDQKLTVNGTVHATRVKVETTVPGPDYVFENSYSLPTLNEVKSYIDENKHLPEVPSAKEMETKGIDVGEMNMLLLKKVEELTLYILQQEQRIKALEEKGNH